MGDIHKIVQHEDCVRTSVQNSCTNGTSACIGGDCCKGAIAGRPITEELRVQIGWAASCMGATPHWCVNERFFVGAFECNEGASIALYNAVYLPQ